MDDYIVLGRIGEGAHGIVMKGRHKLSGQVVALKKVLLKRLEDGIPETALREIKALQVHLISFCLRISRSKVIL
jgi:cell cycle related kinase